MTASVPTGTVTFLFTDIEGSTQLLKQLGARYSDALAEHQRILRVASDAFGGREVDTQGDSFFFAFGRAKDAVGAAVQGQHDLASTSWPDGAELRVRMGLHTGEPTIGGDRYVGLGVHKAARIAAAGHGGQVLLSSTARDLVEDELPNGVTLRDLGTRRLKDIDRPEHLCQLVVEGLRNDFPPLRTLDREGRRRRRRRLYAGVAAIGILAAMIGTALVTRSGGAGATVQPNSVAVIDAGSNEVVGAIQVGIRPGAVAAGSGSVWVANQEDQTLTRIDAMTQEVVRTIPLTATPTGVAEGEGAVWIAQGSSGTLARVDPVLNRVTTTVTGLTGPVRVSGAPTGSVTVGAGSVWVAFGNSAVARVDPDTDRVTETGFAGFSASAIAYGQGFVWVANLGQDTVSQLSPVTSKKVDDVNVGRDPRGVAVGAGAVWVADNGDGAVSRVDARSHSSTTIRVERGPVGIAYGAGGVWVANSEDGTVSRIDPTTSEVVAKIEIGNRPVGLAVIGGRVWVSVDEP